MDNGIEVRSVFLDISKATNKVWHEGIKFTLFQNGISGELLNFLKYILKDRKKRVVMNEVPVMHFSQILIQKNLLLI